MGSNLTIHPASSEEVIAAHRNVFDIWSKGLSLDDHIRYRLESPSHERATWFVGCIDGRVVTSPPRVQQRIHEHVEDGGEPQVPHHRAQCARIQPGSA